MRSRIRAALVLAVALTLVVLLGASAPARTGSLTTIFNADNGAQGNTFDLSVLKRKGVVVESFDLNTAGSSGLVGVYTRPGSAVGFEDTLAGWTLRDSAVVTPEGTDERTPAPLSFSLPRGDYGIAIGVIEDSFDIGVEYTNGEDTFENGDLRLTAGAGIGAPILESDNVNVPRIWNGTIYYSTPSCEFAKKKLKKAKRQVKKAKRGLEDAESSGNPARVAEAERKLEKKLKKRKNAKRTKRGACS